MLLIDGNTVGHPYNQEALSTGPDGCHPPFYVFDTGLQDSLAGPVPTREMAERLLSMLAPYAADDRIDSNLGAKA